jgi:hypothetical protein
MAEIGSGTLGQDEDRSSGPGGEVGECGADADDVGRLRVGMRASGRAIKAMEAELAAHLGYPRHDVPRQGPRGPDGPPPVARRARQTQPGSRPVPRHASGRADVLRQWAKNLRKAQTYVIGKRWVRGVVAVFVAAAPVYYTFVPPPQASIWRLGDARIVVMAVWIVLVVIGAYAASMYEIAHERLTRKQKRDRTQLREQAGVHILQTLLGAADKRFSGYKWTLYVPLRGGRQIGPMPGLRYADARVWHRGESVTGTAWKTGLRTEGAEADLLAPEGKYAAWDGHSNPDIREVVAFPVFNVKREVIAVVTAVCSRHPELLSTKDGLKYHVDLSVNVGRVLVEILGYGE